MGDNTVTDIEGLQIGETATFKRTFTQEDLDRFAALSGDNNPIHVDPEFAARTRFGRTVAHGMLLYGTVCRVLGTQLPGPGTLQIEQDFIFPSPTYPGEEVTVQVQVIDRPAPPIAVLSVIMTRPSREVSCEGHTLVALPGISNPPPMPPTSGPAPVKESTGDKLMHLALGQSATVTRTFTSEDLAEYADITGDTNPVFADEAYARRAGLGGVPVPGPLIGGLFSYLLGMRLPGKGSMWLKQSLNYPTPAYVGQELAATVQVIRLRPEKYLANLRSLCTNPAGEVVCIGESLVYVKDVEI